MNLTSKLLCGTSILGARSLLAAGLLHRRDGWRRAAAIVLRRDPGTFILSAFGLRPINLPSDPNSHSSAIRRHITATLDSLLASESICHVSVAHSEHEDILQPCGAPAYSLAFEDWLNSPARFLPPTLWRQHAEHPASLPQTHDAFVDIVCRARADGLCDLWFRFNHAATDGVPAQALVSRLEKAWDARENVLYPTPEEFIPFALPRPSFGREGLAEIHTFVDLSRLLAWRTRENAALPQPMTVSAALSWHLAAHPAFAHHHIASTVEVAPTPSLPSGVGLVILKPFDYPRSPAGLARFVRDFNHLIVLNRRRATTACKTLDAAAFLPTHRARALLLHALRTNPKAFGSLGLTILKDAKVFGAPIAAVGHDHGFLAMGSAALPTHDGRRVACLSAKGLASHIASYPALLRDALSVR